MKQNLPLAITQILTSKEWAGGRLLQLENDESRPTANDVVMNYWWLRPVAKRFPKSVPSAFFCADVFLYLNHHFIPEHRILILINKLLSFLIDFDLIEYIDLIDFIFLIFISSRSS